MASRYNRRGFTLIEVLITVGILSTAIVFLLRSFTASIAAGKFSQDITLGCYLAEEKLWEIETAFKIVGMAMPEVKEVEIQNRKFNWKFATADTAPPSDLKALKLEVFWKENMREKEYTMDFLTFLPVPK